MSKSYLGHIDTRNSKYQGFVTKLKSKTVPHGIGIMIDDLMLFILTNWQSTKEVPSGPTFIAYPQRQLLFGNIEEGLLAGLGCFVSKESYFYGNFINNRSQNKLANGKIAVIFNNEKKTVYQVSVQQLGQQQQQISVKLVQAIECESQQDIWKAIQGIVEVSIPQQMKSQQKFIKKNFIEGSQRILEMSQSHQGCFIGFCIDETLGITLNEDIVKSVGLYSKNGKSLLLGKKYVQKTYKNADKVMVQQGIFSPQQDIVSYAQDETERPSQVSKIFQQSFKRSTTFQNKYVKMGAIDYLYKYLSMISSEAECQTAQRFGQDLLQWNKPEIQEPNKIFSLDEIKEDIYSKVNHKRTSRNLRQTPYREIQQGTAKLRNSSRIQTQDVDYSPEQEAIRKSRSRSNSNRESHRKYRYVEEIDPTMNLKSRNRDASRRAQPRLSVAYQQNCRRIQQFTLQPVLLNQPRRDSPSQKIKQALMHRQLPKENILPLAIQASTNPLLAEFRHQFIQQQLLQLQLQQQNLLARQQELELLNLKKQNAYLQNHQNPYHILSRSRETDRPLYPNPIPTTGRNRQYNEKSRSPIFNGKSRSPSYRFYPQTKRVPRNYKIFQPPIKQKQEKQENLQSNNVPVGSSGRHTRRFHYVD